jgi:hypothetical protein
MASYYLLRVALVTVAAAIIPFIGYLWIGGRRLGGIPVSYWPLILLMPAVVTFAIAAIVYR